MYKIDKRSDTKQKRSGFLRKLINIAAVSILCLSFLGVFPVHAEDSGRAATDEVHLTEQQKQELSQLQKDVLAKKKVLIQKYIEYGVISKEKGKEIMSHMEKHAKEIEKNGFKMPHYKGHKSKK